jgi:hypothetical protein
MVSENAIRFDPLKCFVGVPANMQGETTSAEAGQSVTPVRAAPYNSRRPPSLSEFREVEVRKISPSEIVFYWSESPRTELMMLMFGELDCPICAVARVIHERESYWRDKWQFVIRCQFVNDTG